jgi:hypothetical protein
MTIISSLVPYETYLNPAVVVVTLIHQEKQWLDMKLADRPV